MIPIRVVLDRLVAHGLLASPGPETDRAVTGITDDSRAVRAGDLYVAVRGYVHDGHDYLKDAAEAGAVAALVETPNAAVHLPQFRVTDGRRAAAVAASVVFGHGAGGPRLVGVTGTNGKTTTVHIARHLLSASMPTASIGTLGVVDAEGRREATQLTTPGPVDFQRRLAALREGGAECVVAEVSSHALTQGRVEGAAFEVAAFTNLTRDHLDYHADADAYRAAKARLADLVTGDGTLVVNADEAAWADLPRDRRWIRFALEAEADYRAREIELGPHGSRWTLSAPDVELDVTLPLPGDFNVANALAAVGIARAFGLDIGVTADLLATVPPVPGRLEVIASTPLVIRDYAHTPEALRRALAALRPAVAGRLIVVFGCGGDRDAGKRPLMGQAAVEGADHAIVTSDNPRHEPPDAIIADIVPGMGSGSYEVIVDRRRAIARALKLADAGDAVLLAGKGHEEYQIVGDERRPFDEAVLVGELLAEKRGDA
ncbi:MAG: UDP-N-acetylmuramoyl-L-alanyl-D-glutamate--2,6-diaminopimelate ligase [Gemmatimonadetes bacterium]|uniref:UDP-N-acetylmuramoyl-L-alanyl-D-glutamate--2,6-diaminopimelate ligase n=1 Tax=Candidatus Kutchimonas denitrificans TaxID=3056748 RepID=A0AAE4Z6A2_9BACT|nr:UDP-N-acetylmuramoyl-L-alanyl-D-glutamate--2,6-diaminopimelate ligase [Gemmatimonadota bacterium]NIR74544.1 UDP-N-acetylmuramoyl-L-alanyl-D-glutamate--2,6-diaminopimelate ligase [Candidatus Kutchimonas denitrificans]NIS02734.1 UDP-N-acetylmuramoyl-L-alanyl-D-glutamate--2,6-diaminopimelate ligase [Gemmatimonadota bacterium]NIT68895.1 UDP-N-acetylmuramoyl-L-alanyl-D-glutamate--2,6-diaminopimelate ligase [Gemmatimonadota bacterium]NIU52200.1 UDP-N-acetylmuramoyl-L-alanyl-D-glutamate--2,6-diamin